MNKDELYQMPLISFFALGFGQLGKGGSTNMVGALLYYMSYFI